VRSVIGGLGPAPWVYLSGASYDAAGRVTRQNWGNGLETTYAYEPETLRLTQIRLAPGGVVTPLLDLAYDYDPVGNVAVLTDTARAEVASFAYDERDRLMQAGGPYSETYGLSEMGNVLTRTVEGEVRGYTYGETEVITTPVPGGLTPRMYLPLIVTPPGYPGAPPATTGQPFAVQALSTGGRFAYDANGNMVERVVVSGTQVTTYTQAFDAMNRLVVVTNTVSGVVTHVGYDAGGARIWQSDGTTTMVYLGDLIEVAIGPSRRITRSYYYAGAQRAAVRVAEDDHEQLYYLHDDHLGSVSLATYGQARPLYLQLYLPMILRGVAGGGETLALGDGEE
jgi:hypothetical protein